jgi:hypothetical protein
MVKYIFLTIVSLLSLFFSLVMQTPIFLTKLSDESIIFISDVGKNIVLTHMPSNKPDL